MMKKPSNEQEAIQLQRRLQNRLDYYVAILLWGLFIFSFVSVWAVGILEPEEGGFIMALQVAPLFLFFPLFATIGLVADRIIVGDLLKYSNYAYLVVKKQKEEKRQLSREDFVLIGLIIFLIFISLPWIAARLGISPVLFFQPLHYGEHHGYIGFYMILSVILISKTEKLYKDSIFKELSIYLLCFLMFWGLGLVIHDFAIEQLNINSFPFVVWGEGNDFLVDLGIQICVIAVLSLIFYYFIWQKYYKRRIN